MIKSFGSHDTELVWWRETVRRLPPDIQRTAHRKLLQINAVTRVESLMVPLGNRLERLRGRRAGQHSVRINAQWRICFVWRDGHAHAVEIVDYHDE